MFWDSFFVRAHESERIFYGTKNSLFLFVAAKKIFGSFNGRQKRQELRDAERRHENDFRKKKG